jgi:cell division inhibitor SulA
MVPSSATTVLAYLDELPAERWQVVAAGARGRAQGPALRLSRDHELGYDQLRVTERVLSNET